MENLHHKSDFRSAYAAGRREIESRRQPFSLAWTIGFAMALVLAFEGNRWSAFRFALSGLEKSLLDFLASFLVISVLLIIVWRLPIKRKNI